ncbi:MAG: hypothetical protein PHH11_17935 [Methylomonas sp.]|nr:hypothetical protein [Methylomonas sp.]
MIKLANKAARCFVPCPSTYSLYLSRRFDAYSQVAGLPFYVRTQLNIAISNFNDGAVYLTVEDCTGYFDAREIFADDGASLVEVKNGIATAPIYINEGAYIAGAANQSVGSTHFWIALRLGGRTKAIKAASPMFTFTGLFEMYWTVVSSAMAIANNVAQSASKSAYTLLWIENKGEIVYINIAVPGTPDGMTFTLSGYAALAPYVANIHVNGVSVPNWNTVPVVGGAVLISFEVIDGPSAASGTLHPDTTFDIRMTGSSFPEYQAYDFSVYGVCLQLSPIYLSSVLRFATVVVTTSGHLLSDDKF